MFVFFLVTECITATLCCCFLQYLYISAPLCRKTFTENLKLTICTACLVFRNQRLEQLLKGTSVFLMEEYSLLFVWQTVRWSGSSSDRRLNHSSVCSFVFSTSVIKHGDSGSKQGFHSGTLPSEADTKTAVVVLFSLLNWIHLKYMF